MIISIVQGNIKAILPRPSKYQILKFCIYHNFHKMQLILACLLSNNYENVRTTITRLGEQGGWKGGGKLVLLQHFQDQNLS